MTYCNTHARECVAAAKARLSMVFPYQSKDPNAWITRDDYVRIVAPFTHLLVAHIVCPVLDRLREERGYSLPDTKAVAAALCEYLPKAQLAVDRATLALGDAGEIAMKGGDGGRNKRCENGVWKGQFQYYDAAWWRLPDCDRFRFAAQCGLDNEMNPNDVILRFWAEAKTVPDAPASKGRSQKLDRFIQTYTAKIMGGDGMKGHFDKTGKQSAAVYAGQLGWRYDLSRWEQFADDLFWILLNLADLRENVISIADTGNPRVSPPLPPHCRGGA